MNLQFWLQVQKEYLFARNRILSSVFLCYTSETFRSKWDQYEDVIKKHAQEFLNSDPYLKNHYRIGIEALFVPVEDEIGIYGKELMRRFFIEYMIKQTSNDTTI